MADRQNIAKVIDEQLKRPDLTSEDVLRLTVARRLNECSDRDFRVIASGQPDDQTPRSKGLFADLLSL